ncbi:MAG: 50S ribosomal protein L13 [Fibrobacter sp.]|nr:50S ribosomal protein L13 [Fibrobacter sp.]
MKTIMVNPKTLRRKWVLVDAADKPMGRVASEVARILMGKHKAIYTPNADTGDFVVVINAEKVALSGKKIEQKKYFHHTGHIGGERWTDLQDLLEKKPTAPLEKAIWGMLPHSILGHKMIKKLKVYAGDTHPHAAQNPEPIEIKV